jgi:hypothetical protein
MSPRDPDFARDQILGYFASLPTIRFEPPSFRQVVYGEPRLVRPPELFSARRSFPELHSGLSELFKCFDIGSQKLEYGRTDRRSWDTYFRFRSDCLRTEPKGAFRVQTHNTHQTTAATR